MYQPLNRPDPTRPSLVVTGAAGFIGNKLICFLVSKLLKENPENYQVIAVVRNPTSADRFSNLKSWAQGSTTAKVFSLVYADLSKKEQVEKALLGLNVEVIYHSAARGGDWGDPKEFYDCNVVGTQNVVDVAKTFPNLRRFLHVSTVDVYPPHVPTAQCVENIYIPKKRRHHYSVTKAEGERIVLRAHKESNLPITITRPAAVFGPGSWSFGWEESVIIWQGHDKWFNGVFINGSYHACGAVFVDDCADHILSAAASPNTIGKIYNCSVYQDVSWREYYYALADGIGKRRPWISIPSWIAKIIALAMETIWHAMGWEGSVDDRPLLTLFLLGLIGRPQLWPMDASTKDFGWKPKFSFKDAMKYTTPWIKAELIGQEY